MEAREIVGPFRNWQSVVVQRGVGCAGVRWEVKDKSNHGNLISNIMASNFIRSVKINHWRVFGIRTMTGCVCIVGKDEIVRSYSLNSGER